MQDDNELQAQSVLTLASFKEWAYQNIMFARALGINSLRNEVLNNELKKYLVENGFSEDTKLIDGTYIEILVIKE